ncbi:NAD(P)-binding domain-containing protein [Gammaproteobacteria bacterium]|jgi:6-phosphogluconate dehydrogenase|nr:hypothetical protein [Opitutae bacterium]MBT6529282.1 hypothetical protein [Betaproteobacteria bacterium]MDB4826733.1 NAD(P)-binding domain-containing protein [Gammaproteobacteria bacterium]
MARTIGLCGLGEMGRNIALNWRDHGFLVKGYDPSPEARNRFSSLFSQEAYSSLSALVSSLPAPRIICIMAPNSKVEILANEFDLLLSSGDIVVDAGNSNFEVTETRQVRFARNQIEWIGVGVSGGTNGARNGPAVMAGGTSGGVEKIRSIFEPIAAQTNDGQRCFAYVGSGGAGHFAKMVHNGIEYAEMQSIAEAAYLCRCLGLKDAKDVSKIFNDWGRGELCSYLLQISAEVLLAEFQNSIPLIEVTSDQASDSGTGRWFVSAALSLGVATPTINAALLARLQSSSADTRKLFKNLIKVERRFRNDQEFIYWLHDALLGARIVAFSQGLDLLTVASKRFGWNVDVLDLLRTWRAGSIIQCHLLDQVFIAKKPIVSITDFLSLPFVVQTLERVEAPWRRLASLALNSSLPIPVLAAGIQWLDIFRTERLWTDMVQVQRDYFGAHGLFVKNRSELYKHDWNSEK